MDAFNVHTALHRIWMDDGEWLWKAERRGPTAMRGVAMSYIRTCLCTSRRLYL